MSNPGPEFTGDGSDPAPPIGAGLSGIDSVAIDPELYPNGMDLNEMIEQAFRHRVVYGVVTMEQYDAAMRFVDLVRTANSGRVIELEEGIAIIDEEREPELVLASQEVYGGSESQRIYYLVARPDYGYDESLSDVFRDNVDKTREMQELAISIIGTMEVPRDRDPVIFPVESDYDDQSRTWLVDEALTALDDKVITKEEFDLVNIKLHLRDILKRELGGTWIQEGQDGNFWRFHTFPRTRSETEDDE